eukprot:6953995-Pyramimonas_sp.AAC.1
MFTCASPANYGAPFARVVAPQGAPLKDWGRRSRASYPPMMACSSRVSLPQLELHRRRPPIALLRTAQGWAIRQARCI